MLPAITNFINYSLMSGVVPPELHPHKKPPSDIDCLQNYRPISNLTFLAKVLERVTKQPQNYFKEHHLYANMQSACRQFHSTETALLRITSDLLRAVDQHQEAVLVLIDLSIRHDQSWNFAATPNNQIWNHIFCHCMGHLLLETTCKDR